jgi:membrane-bound inhibitor of C-type lysozyme
MRAALLSLLALTSMLAACDRAPAEPPAHAAAPTQLPDTAAQKAQHWWVCGEVSVSTQLQGELLMLSGPFGERALPAQPAASGSRYADDQGTEFWNKGGEAHLKVDWKDVGECTEDQASS